ncbi:ribosomal protein L1, partial [Pluteus cervinus]
MAISKDELVDDHVSLQQCKKAINALLTHERQKAEERQETELIEPKEPHVWLNVTVKKMAPINKIKPAKIPIVHPLVDPRTTPVCLITKDPQREYKDLLETHKIKFIHRVVGLEKLKGKWKPFEARRMLLKENGLFLADERVIPLLPRLLGKKWFEAKKQPIPVCLTRKDLKGELERAISSTYMNQNKGTCTSIKVGVLSQTPEQIMANIQTALPAIVKRIQDGWDNIQNLHIKTNSSVSLPIWSCSLGDSEGGRWDGFTVEADAGGSGSDGSDDDEDTDMEDPAPPPKVQGKGKKRTPEDQDPPDHESPKKRAK